MTDCRPPTSSHTRLGLGLGGLGLRRKQGDKPVLSERAPTGAVGGCVGVGADGEGSKGAAGFVKRGILPARTWPGGRLMPLGKAWRAINASSTPLRPLPLGQSLWTRPTACAPSSPTCRPSRLCRGSNSLCAAPPSPGWSLAFSRPGCFAAPSCECSDPSRLAAHSAGQLALPEEPLWPRRKAQNNNGNNKRGGRQG